MRLGLQGLADIARYLLMEGEANDGAHAPVVGWLWWALNPNSVDVGGLVRLTSSASGVDFMLCEQLNSKS